MSVRRWIAAALAAGCPWFLGGATAARRVSAEDYQRLVAVRSPAIAPDGKHAALVVSRTLWNDDRRTNDLVLVDLNNGATQTLIQGRQGLADPRFSPDGAQIAFLADEPSDSSAYTQIFVMPAGGGEPQAVTHGRTDVDEFSWRPDGRAFAYAAADRQPQRTGADRFRDSFVFTTEPVTAREAPHPSHIFTVALDGGATTQLTFGAQSVATGDSLSWSPDGTTIAFTLVPNAILNDESYSRIALVDVATSQVRPLTGRSAWEGGALFSPDGSHIAYAYSNGDPEVYPSRLYLTTPAGGPGHLLSTRIDRPIGDAVWLRDSSGLIVTVPDRTTNALYQVSLNGAATRIDIGDLVPGTPLNTTGGADPPSLQNALAADGTLAFIATSTPQPLELFKHSPNGATSKLTDFNAALAQLDWAKAERVRFPTSTGIAADGVLYLPPGFSAARKYPLVVYIHGGPGDPTMMEFDFWAQVMAAQGWLVLRPNYRGTPNLGVKYQRAILYDPEDGPGKDIISAVNAVRARGIVDKARIAVCGWSYGGIMTAWLISKYHFWRVAVSGASVNDWITDYGTADDSLADLDMLRGSPFVGNNAAEWRRVSAISYAADVSTPVLILSDVGDNRDPFATSSMYWRALRDNHKDATLRVWPIDGHFPDDPVRIADIFHYWIEYISQHFQSP
ncbi:MAG: S9 family peptidase [Candidatus Eremiobacteraeota bacterium]|nr:S9 family peptidase [Candidatus Eremiobacteraeota bacterium]